MAEWTMATVLKTTPLEGIDEMLVSPPRVITAVDWAFAPEWLTLEEASFLSGHDRGYLLQVIEVDGVDLDNEGRIEKLSLWEWQEVTVELAHWDD